MERFFRVKRGSKVDITMRAEKENCKKFFDFYEKFREEHGIQSKQVYISSNLGIGATHEDIEKFGAQLKQDKQWFRKNSHINKKYQEGLKESGINIDLARGLGAWGYGVMAMGRYSTTKMYDEANDTYYFRYDGNEDDLQFHEDDFEEIKGSEWYTIKERIETK